MRRTASAWVPDDLEVDKNIWMLSFECQGLASVGGLGVAVYNLARILARKHQVSVFMPSHGSHLIPSIRAKYNLSEVPNYLAVGYRVGEDRNIYPYRIALEHGSLDNVDYYLFEGADPATSRWLDNQIIYDHDITYEKMALFARGLRAYVVQLCVNSALDKLPHILHIHDWHSVPAGIAVKQELEDRRYFCPTVFTIHLLSLQRASWHFISEEWSQIRDEAHFIWLQGRSSFKGGYREVWDVLAKGYIERFGAYEADLLTTVSYSYLKDILSFLGADVEGKSCVFYNGCDWEYDVLREEVLKTFGGRIKSLYGLNEVKRWDLRRFLLTKALGENKPYIRDEGLRKVIFGLKGVGAIQEEGSVKSFDDDGPLVLMTSRLDWQKGVDILLEAVPTIIRRLSEAKFLLLLMPINHQELIHKVVYEASKYPKNVRLLFGETNLFHLSYLSADAYTLPSRWEPFGIAALEAMACGTPVVGSNVGGLRETVLDINEHREKSTGMLVPPESPEALAEGIISILVITKVDELTAQGLLSESKRYIELVPNQQIRDMLLNNPRLCSRIRHNCISRVSDHFRWSNATEMAKRCYDEARKMAEYRASACFQ
ncbi:MAG: glycogen/starch synthase [Nitrososphaerales archaeon]